MRPDDSRPTGPIIPKRPYLRPEAERARPVTHDAAANVVRGQIDTIYQGTSSTKTVIQPVEQKKPAEQPVDDANPYDRTHQADRTTIQPEQWKRYHSAWQDYYRQYYERYYLGEIYRMRQALENRLKPAAPATESARTTLPDNSKDTPDTDEVVFDLKSTLLGKVGSSAKKVRRSRHFIPLMAAALTMIVFLFLQFNPFIFGIAEAYVSPGNIDPSDIIVDPAVSVPVSKDSKLIIPKINVDVPVIYNTTPDQAAQLNAMQKGVAWFGIPGAESHPGQVGNTVLSGHSSNDWFDPGDFKFIFARLPQLQIGDTFYLNYDGVRYTYSITKTEVVRPTDVYKLIYKTDKPIVTLITCVPVGTAQSRLLVTAEQVSPDPSTAKPAPDTPNQSNSSAAIPGNSPTLLNRLFGGN